MKKILFLLLVLLLLILPLMQAQETDIVIFYGQGCPHCAQLHEYLNKIKPLYSDLKIYELEVYSNQENREKWEKMANAYDSKIYGVPTIYINDKELIGYNNEIQKQLEQEVTRCIKDGCGSPFDKTAETITKQIITIPAVISAAAVDAINPCAFAVLIILLTTILTTKERKRALYAGLAFSTSIFLSYFLMGLGLYSAVQASRITHKFYLIVAILAILIGLFNLKDYLWYGKWFTMEVPLTWRPKMKSLLKKVTSIPGAFLMGFLISLFLLPCTSGPYIVILGLLAKATTKNHAMFLLILYNLIFILPMILITLAIYFGFTTTEKAEEWRQSKLKVLHLIAGIIILLLGISMIIALNLGMI